MEIKSSAALMSCADKWVGGDWSKARNTVRTWRYKSHHKPVRANLKGRKKLVDDATAYLYGAI